MVKKLSEFLFFSQNKFQKSNMCIYILLALCKLIVNICSLCVHRKTKKIVRGFSQKNFVDFQNFQKFNEDPILMETNI